MECNLVKLAAQIMNCEEEVKRVGLNGTTAMQVRANEKLSDYKHAFALVTDTIVNSMHFNSFLHEAYDEINKLTFRKR